MSARLVISVFAAVVAGCVVAVIVLPSGIYIAGGLAGIWELFLLLSFVVTLLGFVYSIWFKRILRARKIRSIGMKRLLREATGQDSRDAGKK